MNLFKFVWPRDLVVARRIDSLCELVLNPKPLSIRQSRKRKSPSNGGRGGRRKKTRADVVPEIGDDQAAKSEELSEVEAFDSDEDADEEDEGNVQSIAADQHADESNYERNQHSWREIALNKMPMEEASLPQASSQQAPLQQASLQQAPLHEPYLQQAPFHEAHSQQASIQQAPLHQVPAQSWPIENRFPIENATTEKALTEEKALYQEAIIKNNHMEDVNKYAMNNEDAKKVEPVENVVEETKTLGSGAETSVPVWKSGE